MKFSLSHKITFSFLVAIILLAIVSYFYFTSTQAFIQSSNQVQQSQKVMTQLEVVMSLIKDAETGQRGFIITENEVFLTPYYTASSNLENELLELSLLMKDSAQMRRYESLVPDISSMMARLDFSIDLIRRNEFDTAISYIVSATGKRYMDKIRDTIQTMKEEEKAKLSALAKKEEENAQYTFVAVLVGAVLTSLFLILSLVRIIQEIVKKKTVEMALHRANENLQEAQKNLQRTNNELEIRVQERTKALALSEERYRSLIMATTSIVWTANDNGEILTPVPSWEKFTGQQQEQYQGLGWLKAMHPDDREKIKAAWKKAKKERSILRAESRLGSSEGEYRYILLYGVPIVAKQGKIKEWIGTISDIHDRKKAEEALIMKKQEVEAAYEKAESSNTKLKNVNKVLETFVYAAAHDLKAPIINIKSLFNFVNKTKDVNKKMELIQRFEEAINRLDNTINGLGEIIEVQEVDNSTVKTIYFQDLLDQIKAEYSYKMIASEAELQADFNECQDIVYLESYLNSIMTNLVTNALKYHREDVPLLLKIKTTRENDMIVLVFKDNGIGMDLERYGNNLFKPFKRFTKKAEGKGIGLHIIKSMIEKNGGRIEVESVLGEGTTFKCYLKEYEFPKVSTA